MLMLQKPKVKMSGLAAAMARFSRSEGHEIPVSISFFGSGCPSKQKEIPKNEFCRIVEDFEATRKIDV